MLAKYGEMMTSDVNTLANMRSVGYFVTLIARTSLEVRRACTDLKIESLEDTLTR